jgi:ATP-binding cassette, subfamily B, bacterial
MKYARNMLPFLVVEKKGMIMALCFVVLTAGLNLIGPLAIGHVIDAYIPVGDYQGVMMFSGILLAVYLGAFVSNYLQMRVMGGVAQRMLWRLRNDLFAKLQALPLAFFNEHKTGDLISRINNDTEKLNQFFSQGLMRFAGNFFLIIGAGVFILSINWRLALAALAPALGIFIFTRLVSKWVGGKNALSLSAGGALGAEIQESINNFKVIVAFDRRDYFKSRFGDANRANFKAAVGAGVVNEMLTPVFELAGNVALLVVLAYGVSLIAAGQFAVGLLVSFVLYVTRFYDPLREVSRLWSVFQTALAAWGRVNDILGLDSELKILPADLRDHAGVAEKPDAKGAVPIIEFKDVSFGYPGGKTILGHINFSFEKGKTYALVGPTGGGKTTTASLIARLYDPTEGLVLLDGRDIRSYEHANRTQRVGFILQDPFLFAGTVRENILYGNAAFAGVGSASGADSLEKALAEAGLDVLMSRFDKGLDTPVASGGALSLGQRQLIAFIRAVLRRPEILILDEATANIDTVTEEQLQTVLDRLPADTARVIIAHRLNTIENADEIFFVNGGAVTPAGSMEHALEMLLHGHRAS